MRKIQPGAHVHDCISGFTGIVTAYTIYQNGNVKCCVESCELDNGKPIAEQWLDEYRLEIVPRPKTRCISGLAGAEKD